MALRIKDPDIGTESDLSSDEDIDRPYEIERKRMSFSEDKWFYRVRVGFLIFTSFATLAVVTIYMLHLILPEELRWLCDGDVSKIKDLALTIIVGLIMSSVTTYFFKSKH